MFTSGGVGPTHDDVTLPAVAKAFGRELVRAELIERLIRDYHGERITEDHLRMADIPEGARLLSTEEVPWPTIAIENVYVFPGVPEIFRMKFPAVRPELETGRRFFSRAVYTACDEGQVAALLRQIADDHPSLAVGSYPRFRDRDHKLKVTFDGSDPGDIDRGVEQLLAGLSADEVVRVE